MLSNGNVRSNNRASARGRLGEDFYLLATLALFSVTHAKLRLRKGGTALGSAVCRRELWPTGRRAFLPEGGRGGERGRGEAERRCWARVGKLEVAALGSAKDLRAVVSPWRCRSGLWGCGEGAAELSLDRALVLLCLQGLVYASAGTVFCNIGKRLGAAVSFRTKAPPPPPLVRGALAVAIVLAESQSQLSAGEETRKN